MKRSVFALLQQEPGADTVIKILTSAGIAPGDISILFPSSPGIEPTSKAPEGTATGGTTGFVLGGVLGLMSGVGSLAIPGLGPFIAAGPILSALSGAAVGAALGGITGALIGMGIPEYEARQYEAQIKEGRILLSVHAEDGESIKRVLQILKAANAQEIATSGEAEPLSTSAEPTGVSSSTSTPADSIPPRPSIHPVPKEPELPPTKEAPDPRNPNPRSDSNL